MYFRAKVSSVQTTNSQISSFFTNSTNDVEAVVEPSQSKKDDEIHNETSVPINNCSNKNDSEVESMSIDHTETQRLKTKRKIDQIQSINTKTTIKSFFTNENNESICDFEIPKKLVRKPPKKLPVKSLKSSRSHSKQPDIRKVIKKRNVYSYEPSTEEDIQLRIALALSQEEFNNENQLNGDNKSYSTKLKEFQALFYVNPKATARHKWDSKCTQLTRRKENVQTKKLREKIDEILVNNIVVESSTQSNLYSNDDFYTIYSRRLQCKCIPEQVLFEANRNGTSCDRNIRMYYTNDLVEPSEFKAGILLKDWSKIPGRDAVYDGIESSELSVSADNEIECSQPSVSASGEIDSNNLDEHEKTIVLDEYDIQSKVNTINSHIRLSQDFANELIAIESNEPTILTQSQSPNLFDDDDFLTSYPSDTENRKPFKSSNEHFN